jgi:hypothetical protein
LVIVPEFWLSVSGHWAEQISSSVQVSTPLQSCNMYKLHSALSLYALYSDVYNKFTYLVNMCSFPLYTDDNPSS